MLSILHSAALSGLQAVPIEVQVVISAGFPSFTIVGLPDTSIQESKERIRAAIKQVGVQFPDIKLVVNLAPANIRKAGPRYDLPIAMGILAAKGVVQLPEQPLLCIGELSLDGSVRPVTGILAMTMMAQQRGYTTIMVPADNAAEAALVPDIEVYPVQHLQEMVKHLSKDDSFRISPQPHTAPDAQPTTSQYDFAHIRGHASIKRALEIVAAGGHHILLYGPPGSGKTLLAKALVSILPSMTVQEMLEATTVYSVAGLLDEDQSYLSQRPFRSPHHSASTAALVGGGSYPRPGEISLAHHGVLYLDELPEFKRSVIETLRQPLEDHTITVSRAQQSVTYPAQCIFVGSLNPCPCGFFGDADRECSCTPKQIQRYQKKLSGPLLDRMDLCVYVPRIEFEVMNQSEDNESSSIIQKRVQIARDVQRKRYGDTIVSNAYMDAKTIQTHCALDNSASSLLQQASTTMHLSPRSYHRILRVARTIADLAGTKVVQRRHISEALQYRQLSQMVSR